MIQARHARQASPRCGFLTETVPVPGWLCWLACAVIVADSLMLLRPW